MWSPACLGISETQGNLIHQRKNQIFEQRLATRPDLVGRIGWTNALLREVRDRALVVTAGSPEATVAKMRALRQPWVRFVAGIDKSDPRTFEGMPKGFILLDDDPKCVIAACRAGGAGVVMGGEADWPHAMELMEGLIHDSEGK